ncbi:GNAT family N-acetyltransferase [Paenibacillus alkalitolerans]|uniref:GNAT family N-acetyltransferase n=1 Tax=Paenibacillus alkalitolerans TaxID=2799335 RepID=UPI001F2B1A3B|nr:GNAT family N-acetyltransferase [Paenibacillus alkalitolerans]
MITVKQATVHDLNELAPLFDQYRVFYGQPSDEQGAREFMWERFAHLQSVVFAARDERSGETVGFAQLYPTFSSISLKRDWILNDLFVAEKARGQGAAAALLKAAAAYAKETGAKGIGLSTAADNTKAQRLYEAHGFVKDDEFLAYYKKNF